METPPNQSPASPDPGILNPQTLTVETTPAGGVQIKLPTLVLAHVLSLAGVCGGAYNVTRQDAEQTKREITKLRSELDARRQFEMSLVDRLARMEATIEDVRDTVYVLRPRRGRVGAMAAPVLPVMPVPPDGDQPQPR